MIIKIPQNVIELIDNLFELSRIQMAFNEAFYTEENIRKATATLKTRIIRAQGRSILEAKALDFRAITDNLKADGSGISVSIQLRIHSNGKKGVIIHGAIVRAQKMLDYRTIEQMLDNTWQRHAFEPKVLIYQFDPKLIVPDSNKKVRYFYQDDHIIEKSSLAFNSDGLLYRFSLWREEL